MEGVSSKHIPFESILCVQIDHPCIQFVIEGAVGFGDAGASDIFVYGNGILKVKVHVCKVSASPSGCLVCLIWFSVAQHAHVIFLSLYWHLSFFHFLLFYFHLFPISLAYCSIYVLKPVLLRGTNPSSCNMMTQPTHSIHVSQDTLMFSGPSNSCTQHSTLGSPVSHNVLEFDL